MLEIKLLLLLSGKRNDLVQVIVFLKSVLKFYNTDQMISTTFLHYWIYVQMFEKCGVRSDSQYYALLVVRGHEIGWFHQMIMRPRENQGYLSQQV